MPNPRADTAGQGDTLGILPYFPIYGLKKREDTAGTRRGHVGDSVGQTTLRPDRKALFFAGCIHGRYKAGKPPGLVDATKYRVSQMLDSPPPPPGVATATAIWICRRLPSAEASPPNGNHAGAGNLDLFHLFESIFFIDSCCLLPLFVMPLLQLLASYFPMLLMCRRCCLLTLLLPCAAATCLC